MTEIQMCYAKNVLQIIIIMIMHYYYHFQSVQSPSQPQRAVHFSSASFAFAPTTTAF